MAVSEEDGARIAAALESIDRTLRRAFPVKEDALQAAAVLEEDAPCPMVCPECRQRGLDFPYGILKMMPGGSTLRCSCCGKTSLALSWSAGGALLQLHAQEEKDGASMESST